MEEKVTVLAKRKTTPLLFDYCMDQKIVFTVSPRPMIADEFEIDIQLGNIKQAIAIGMFLKENKYEVFGLGEYTKAKPVSNGNGNGKKAEPKEDAKAPEEATLLNF
ncbi:MAG: hypothetical protein MUC81_05095 [Bacteroidia bacterium]|jgi:hypothetical protein|nr:hypothetical protein [Bacteroidia bacterium]